MLQLLLFVLPLGIDTLGVSISLGIKSAGAGSFIGDKARRLAPSWLSSAVLFSLAETSMPLIGLALGYAASLLISGVMHIVGPLLLIGVGGWELLEELRERLDKRNQQGSKSVQDTQISSTQVEKVSLWRRQFLLALSVSLDELAIGFSLGSITTGKSVSPFLLCLLIGVQGFLMTLLGITLGRILRTPLRPAKEWSELISGFLLIGLGFWLLVT